MLELLWLVLPWILEYEKYLLQIWADTSSFSLRAVYQRQHTLAWEQHYSWGKKPHAFLYKINLCLGNLDYSYPACRYGLFHIYWKHT